MTLAPGTRLGPYAITGSIGAGGMGEVYKATDTRLDRTVAVKVLPEHVAADPALKQRFEHEAKTLAALSHPHICPVFDVGSQAGIDFLVMEYLEGETLEQRLKKGALPLDQALQVGIQVADALAAAHRAGIIHRDLKPGNVMLTKTGAKLLDFGLAKVGTPAAVGSLSMLPTTPPGQTQPGAILGTFQYMAPEQLEGHEADPRTDIFAFGTVVYEMVTGKKAFEGKSQASLIAAILEREPPALSSLQPVASFALDRIVATCLAKEPDDRWQTARDLLRELKWVVDGTTTESRPGTAGRAASAGPSVAQRRHVLPWAVAGVLGTALAIAFVVWSPWAAPPPSAPVRFEVVPPPAQPFAFSVADREFVISQDGERIAYVAGVEGAQEQLVVRGLDRLHGEPLGNTLGARWPFFSPDGQWVGFFSAGGGVRLSKVSITGGAAITLCEPCGEAPRGASWAPNGTIVFATGNETTGLMSVPADGGEPTVLTRPDAGRGELDHLFPSVLPGGRAVLFTSTSPRGIDDAQVAVLSLETGEQKTLIRGGSSAEYVDSGHLVYATAGTLRAVRFDPVRLEVLSDPVAVLEQVSIGAVGAARFSVSRTGTLVYLSAGPLEAVSARSLVWVDRQGREEPVEGPPRAYYALRLSPDATHVALDIRDQEDDIWVWDFMRETLTRLTFTDTTDAFPIWTPDGRRIIFRSVAANALLSVSADGTGAQERVHVGGGLAMSLTPDGKNLVFAANGDLHLLPMDSKGQNTPLMETAFGEGLAEISSDGRWLAYQSNESGRDQIYVRPFPDVNSGRWQVSPGGGTKPAWARSGRELFYLDAGGALTAVSIETTPTFRAGNPNKLFETRYLSAVNARSYDVSPDGQRFLMIKDTPESRQATNATPASIIVTLNWFEELNRLVPTN